MGPRGGVTAQNVFSCVCHAVEAEYGLCGWGVALWSTWRIWWVGMWGGVRLGVDGVT